MADERETQPESSRVRLAVMTAATLLVGAMACLFILLLQSFNVGAPASVSRVAGDERLVFFPSVASYDAKRKQWDVHVHAWLHEPERGSVSRRALKAAIRDVLDVPDDRDLRRLFDERMSLFLADNERGKPVAVRLGSRTHLLGTTDPAGHVQRRIPISQSEMAGWRRNSTDANRPPFQAALPANDRRVFRGTVLVVPDEGLSVVSDIDDTIKITQVTRQSAMLANTLYRPFRPVAGMSGLYRRLHNVGAAFHYVSGSPWQLCEPLQAFLAREEFPAGSMHLRRFRLKDVRSLPNLVKPGNKPAAIQSLLQEFPRRRFAFFGDSGERDPEIYGEFARRHAKQVVAVFIRNVSGESRDVKRMQTAFRAVPAAKWHVFVQPKDVEPHVTALADRFRPRK